MKGIMCLLSGISNSCGIPSFTSLSGLLYPKVRRYYLGSTHALPEPPMRTFRNASGTPPPVADWCDAGRLAWFHQLDEGCCNCAGSVPGWDYEWGMHVADSHPNSETEGGLPGDWTCQGPLEGDREPSQSTTHISNLLPWYAPRVSGRIGDGDHLPWGQDYPTVRPWGRRSSLWSSWISGRPTTP